MTSDKLLGIYLNDHLAGAVAGRQLAMRCRSNNAGTPLGRYLAGLAKELQQDEAALKGVMDRLGMRKDPVKQAAAWVAEKVGRLKFNGQLVGYSPLSRLEELEGLCVGVEAKLSLWRLLRAVASFDPRLAGIPFGELEDRAMAQRKALEQHRVEAGERAFTSR